MLLLKDVLYVANTDGLIRYAYREGQTQIEDAGQKLLDPAAVDRRALLQDGFVANEQTAEVYGRQVGLSVQTDGSLLIADDAGGKIWRVSIAAK